MAGILVQAKALTDARIRVLARQLGINRKEALGALIYVWGECLERGEYRLPVSIVDAAAEQDGMAAAMVEASLAREEEGCLYICGSRGTIEWLAARRESQRAKALARWGNRDKTENVKSLDATAMPRQCHGNATAMPNDASVPVPVSDPVSDPVRGVWGENEDRVPEPGGGSRPRTPSQADPGFELSSPRPRKTSRPTEAESDARLVAKWQVECARLWALQDDLRRQAVPGARALRATDEQLAQVAKILEGGATVAECEHVLRVYAQEARVAATKGARIWFNGQTNWVRKNFYRALGSSPGNGVKDSVAEGIRIAIARGVVFDEEGKP